MSRLTRDGTAEPVSRDQILMRERRQRKNIFPCSADHEQDWQPYPVDPYKHIPTHTCNLVPSPSDMITWFRGMSVGGSFRRV